MTEPMPRCAICDQPIAPGDRCVALSGGAFRHLVCRAPDDPQPQPAPRRPSEGLAHTSEPRRRRREGS